jgi:hypothetical protein
MRNKHGFVLLLITGIGIFGACKSTGTTEVPLETPPPQAAPQPQPPSRADQGALDALDAAIARVEEERKLAQDFQSPSYFPAEWGSAEAEYGSISADRTSTGAVQAAEGRYKALADTYHGLFQNTLPLYADYLVEEGLKLRDQAIAGGIEELLPEYLIVADGKALDAEDAYLAEDYYTALAEALEALDRYRSLAVGVDAYLVREEIERRDFAGFDQANFDRGDQIFLAAIASYEGEAVKEALSEVGEARVLYDNVLKTGWLAYSNQLRGLALQERQNALDVKANVAVRDDFSRVDRIYNQAEAAYNSRNYEVAAGFYIQAEAGFVETILTAEVKRRIAQAAIEAADRKLVESENAVADAERILEGGAE